MGDSHIKVIVEIYATNLLKTSESRLMGVARIHFQLNKNINREKKQF